MRNNQKRARIGMKVKSYRVSPNQNITNKYSEENPTSPGTCIEPIEEIGREDSRKDHDLNVSR